LFQSDVAGGPFALDIELSILFPMIERMLGGDLHATTPHSRPLTDIEKRLATRIAERFLQELQTVWQQMGTFGLAVASIESEPRKTEPLLSKESVACIQWQVVIGSSRGAICLAVPWGVVEKLGAFGNDEDDRQQASDDSLSGEKVELSAVLAQTRIAAADLQSLQVGDIITMDNEVGDLLEVTVEGEVRFRASPGVLEGHKAIRIE
jgi:flagellar motor switch protein FliM